MCRKWEPVSVRLPLPQPRSGMQFSTPREPAYARFRSRPRAFWLRWRLERDWLAVRSAPVGFGPSLLARLEFRRIGQPFGRDQALESRQPMVVVMRAIVGRAFEFLGERGGPFAPGEVPLLGEPDCKRECLRLPGLGKHRS